MRLLLVEDDASLARVVSRELGRRGHSVTVAGSGNEALAAVRDARFDVAILDRVLPDLDGIEVLRAWREAGVATPVLVLTGMAELEDKVAGLRSGADDYLTKPFEFEELTARLEALVRRAPGDAPLQLGSVELDPRRRTLSGGAASEKLTERECALLAELARNAGQVLSRERIVETVWRGEPVNTNVVDVYVGYLRTKLERLPGPGPTIISVRGVGFRLDVPRA